MSKVMLSESYLDDIADAIRAKNGLTDTYKPSEMAEAISELGGATLGSKAITENDTYYASSDDLDGYSSVTVNVPNPSAGTINITQNGTVDVTQYASADVNVPSVTPTGTINITQNGTVDVTNYASASVAVPNPSTGTKQISITQNGTTTEDVTNYASAEITVNVSGQTLYYAPTTGVPYAPHIVIPRYNVGTKMLYKGCTELLTLTCNGTDKIGGASSTVCDDGFRACTSLTTANFPYTTQVGGGYCGYFLGECTALENVTFGSIGYPVTEFYNSSNSNYAPFKNTTQSTLTITLYVNASTLAGVPAAVANYSPWGATGATVVYRNSTTGEVITS